MGRAKPVVLETRSFATQGEARDFFSEMLHRYIPGEEVTGDDAKLLSSLFKRHPDHSQKSGVGVKRYEVMPADYGSQCFCVVRLDGTKEGFSYHACLTMKAE
jgi:Protein of unknown function (DUF3223)